MNDCPNCEYHRKRAQFWRDEAYRQAGHPLPKREPAAWMVYTQEGKYAFVTDDPAVIHPSQRALPLYATPQWVGLTDEEIEGAIDDGFAFGLDDGNVSNQYVIRYVRVIEAKLKEKNT
jgi:hypothetical protein